MNTEVPSKGLEWTNLVLGGCLLVAPFALGFTSEAVPAWNAYIVGATVIVASCVALAMYRPWAEWLNVTLGSWALVAPFLLGFAGLATAMWAHVIIGLCVACIAAYQLFKGGSSSVQAR